MQNRGEETCLAPEGNLHSQYDPNILERFRRAIADVGVVGEDRNVQIIYLALTSRFLKQPVSVAVKGNSSAGKSFSSGQTLEFFPKETYIDFTSTSPKLLAYSSQSYKHRFIVMAEATGMKDENVNYFLRSLLSEGVIRYATVEKNATGHLTDREIVKEGPTGLLVTTTANSLHPENETRCLSLRINETADQRRRILEERAKRRLNQIEETDYTEWHALQTWLKHANHKVVIPFALELARSVPVKALRIRRDIDKIQNLIEAHAILHQMNREVDENGCIVATLNDYDAVRALINEAVSIDVGERVAGSIRRVVNAVKKLYAATEEPVGQIEVARELNADKSNVLRDVRGALSLGLLVDLETRKGLPRQLVPRGEMAIDSDVLPDLRRLSSDGRPEMCVVRPAPVVYNHTTVNEMVKENKELMVVKPKSNHIQPLQPSQNQGDTEADDFFDSPIDYEQLKDLERSIALDDQTRHVMNTLRKCGPQTRDYLARMCCRGNRKALNEILGELVKQGDVTIERGQVHYAKGAPAASSTSAHVSKGAVMAGEASAN